MKPADSNEVIKLQEAEARRTAGKRQRLSRFQKLYAEHEEIERQEAKDAGALAFIARFLVQASLPYRRVLDPKLTAENGTPCEKAVWSKTNGVTTLILQSGWDPIEGGHLSEDGRVKTVPIGLPYGSYPRLILAWMTTEVVRTGSAVIEMGENVSDFLRKLDVQATGGQTGALTAVRSQLYRLLNTTIRVVPANAPPKNFKNIQISVEGDTGGELWWKKRSEAQTHLWLPHFQLSEDFFKLLSNNNGVPIDMRAFRKLAQSPMAMDIYSFATYRLHAVDEQKGVFIPWKTLEAQMGGDSTTAKFVENFKRALRQVKIVYPEARMEPTPRGLQCYRSKPSVRYAA